MSKRKTYFNRVQELIVKAKVETLKIMADNDCNEIDVSRHLIYIYEPKDNDDYKERRVQKVLRVKDCKGTGYHLEFEAEGESFWYLNRLLWLDIHEAVMKHFGLYNKIFSCGFKDFLV